MNESFESDDLGAALSLGGDSLPDDTVATAVCECVAHMAHLCDDPTRVTDLPGVAEVLGQLPASAHLPEGERRLLAGVVAWHELGRVPEAHANAVRALSHTHRLGLVTNIWSSKEPWLEELARAGLAGWFSSSVFSSDSRSMKPAPGPFIEALRGCGIDRVGPYPDVVFIGDSLRCDIEGAQAVGLRTIWINAASVEPPVPGPHPDAWVYSLCDLLP